MNSNGYRAAVTFDDQAAVFRGKVKGARDVIVFQQDRGHRERVRQVGAATEQPVNVRCGSVEMPDSPRAHAAWSSVYTNRILGCPAARGLIATARASSKRVTRASAEITFGREKGALDLQAAKSGIRIGCLLARFPSQHASSVRTFL